MADAQTENPSSERSEAGPRRVASRAVYFIGGYEPKSPAEFFRRMERDFQRFRATWDLTATMRWDVAPDGESGRARLEVVREGVWRTRTRFTFLSIDGIVGPDLARPLPARLRSAVATLADDIASGTLRRMLSLSWRFGLYLGYPAFLTLACGLVAGLVAAGLGHVGVPSLLAVLAAPAIFLTLFGTVGRFLYVDHTMEISTFARAYSRGRRGDMHDLLRRFAGKIVLETRETEFDEVLLVGHSLGGALVLELAHACLEADPGIARRHADVSVMTLGSIMPQVGLHPAAWAFRAKVQRLVDEADLHWADYQCIADLINFHRTDPVLALGLKPRPYADHSAKAAPVVREVRISEMLDGQSQQRLRRRPFRVHYQFVAANTKRYFYDFFMRCCGRLPLAEASRRLDADGE